MNEVNDMRPSPNHPSRVNVSITGTNYSGKSTVGYFLAEALQAKGIKAEFTDPDVAVQRGPDSQNLALAGLRAMVTQGKTVITIKEERPSPSRITEYTNEKMLDAITAFLKRVGVVPEVAKTLTVSQALEYLAGCSRPEVAGQAGWFLPLSAINHLQQESLEKVTARAKGAHHCDIDMRINGQNERYEADWVKHLKPVRLKEEGSA